MAEPKPVVAPASEMTDETLLKHFNARHMPIAGLQSVNARSGDEGESLLRRWHENVHRTGRDDAQQPRPVNHDHRPGG